MKQLFALLIALMMVFSLAACDLGNTENPNSDNPGTSQSGENNDGGEENNGGESVEWPSKVSGVAWTGSGKVICAESVIGSSMGEMEIFIDSATMAEFGAYVEMLKGKGISGDDAPTSFSDGYCSWNGNEGAIKITLYESEGPELGYVDGSYQLKIRIQTDAACFK